VSERHPDAGPGATERDAPSAGAILLSLLVAAAAFVLVLAHPTAPIDDQSYLIGYTFRHGYPPFDRGIVSSLLVSLLNAVVPFHPLSTNALVRAVAAAFYLVAAGLLLGDRHPGEHPLLRPALFLGLVFTSRFPFLWLSSELFAGTLLMLVLLCARRAARARSEAWAWPAATALAAVGFGLAKPDLLLPGLLAGAFLAVDGVPDARRRLARLGVQVALFLALLVPAGLSGGASAMAPGERALFSFGQHYASLVARHQVGDAPDPWVHYPRYLARSFGSASGVAGAVLASPSRYLDFLFLSLSRSLQNIATGGVLFLLPFAAVVWRHVPRRQRVLALLLLTNLLPLLCLSFVHVRYLARFYPLVLHVVDRGLGALTGRDRRLLLAFLVGILALQSVQSLAVLGSALYYPD
jgi:hypothetical protein